MGDGTIDFYSPFVAARIIAGDGEVFPLWVSEEANLPNDLISLAYLESVEVQMSINSPPNITLNLTPPYREGKRFLDSKLVEWGVSTIEVQFGYTSGSAAGEAILSPVYSARMNRPEVSIGEDYSITIQGQGLGTDSILWSSTGGTFEGTREDIIKQLLENGPQEVEGMPAVTTAATSLTGRHMQVDFTAVRNNTRLDPSGWDVPISDAAAYILGKFAYHFLQAAEAQANRDLGSSTFLTQSYDLMFTDQISRTGVFISPWSLAQQLVMEARCRMMVVGDLVKVFPLEGWMRSAPARRLRFYDFPPSALEINYTTGGDLPILNVSTNSLQMLAPKEAVYMADIDSETRNPVGEWISDAVTQLARLGNGAVEQPPNDYKAEPSSTGSGANHATGNPKNPNAIANAVNMHDGISMTHLGVQMEVTTLLDPGLLPGMNVQILGVSGRFDGIYGITDATYSIGTGGAEMTMNLLSNVNVTAALYPEVEPTGYQNTSEIEDPGPGTSAQDGT